MINYGYEKNIRLNMIKMKKNIYMDKNMEKLKNIPANILMKYCILKVNIFVMKNQREKNIIKEN